MAGSVPVEKPLRMCFFGTYDSYYPGNAVLVEGLRRNGVVDVPDPVG